MVLDEKIVRKLAENCSYDIHTVSSADSTNDVLARLSDEGKIDSGYMLFTTVQTAGKGRMGRSFFSPETGIYTSLLLRPYCSPKRTLRFTTEAAVAVCRTIEKTAGIKAQIKWVNDVYIDEKKVCGILTESTVSGGSTDRVIVGIGVNITAPEDGFPEDISDRACAIFDYGKTPGGFENRFAAVLAQEIETAYSQDDRCVMDEYKRRSMLIGRQLLASDGGRQRICTALDINDAAELIVSFEDGSIGRLFSGEVSVKTF